jgi:N-dimethylarginine dimethylaminohydrolase
LLNGYVLYYPKAFSPAAQKTIEQEVPAEKRLVVSDKDAKDFACNAVLLETTTPTIIVNNITPTLQDQLQALNYKVIIQPVTEFMKAGGATRCLTLDLTPCA